MKYSNSKCYRFTHLRTILDKIVITNSRGLPGLTSVGNGEPCLPEI